MIKADWQKRLLLLLTIAVLAILLAVDGVMWESDTRGYLNMDISREAGYSLFLRAFFRLFGERIFAPAVVLAQFILLGVAIVVLTLTVTKLWNLSYTSMYLVWGIQVGFLLLLKFGSGFGATYANMLLTEGLTYPLYFLYLKAVLQLEREYSPKRLMEALTYCILLTLIRMQLAVTFMGLIAFWLCKVLVKTFPVRKWCVVLAGSLLGLILVVGAQKIYTYALYGVGTGTVGSSSFLMTSAMYHAVDEDEALFESEEEKEIFRDLHALAMSRGATRQFAPEKGFLPLSEHYAQNFDVIKFEVVSPYLYERYQDEPGMDMVQMQIKVDEFGRKMGLPLFVKHLGGKLEQFLQECIRGYMRTIAKSNLLFALPVGFLYLAYIWLMILNFRMKDAEAMAAGWSAFFVLLISTGNIVLTAFMIFCEPRYVLYNMVPFYITGYLLFRNVYRKRKEEKIR